MRQILVVHHRTLRVAQTPSLHANPTGDRAQPIDWLALLDISPEYGRTCRAGLSAQLCNTLDKKNTYVGATTCVSGYQPLSGLSMLSDTLGDVCRHPLGIHSNVVQHSTA